MAIRLLETIVAAFWLFLLLLVGTRFLALLFGANAESELVEAIYRYSEFWVSPFFGIMDFTNEAAESTGGVFEPASLLALIVYFLIGAVMLALLGLLPGPWYGRRGVTVHE